MIAWAIADYKDARKWWSRCDGTVAVFLKQRIGCRTCAAVVEDGLALWLIVAQVMACAFVSPHYNFEIWICEGGTYFLNRRHVQLHFQILSTRFAISHSGVQLWRHFEYRSEWEPVPGHHLHKPCRGCGYERGWTTPARTASRAGTGRPLQLRTARRAYPLRLAGLLI